ncbi:MAG: YetF domain-containing protein [Candidatus Binatia bacterium]
MLEKLFADLFVLNLPVAEKVIRPVIIYVFLVIGLRLAGKRELAQLNPFDFVVLMTLSNAVQNGIIGDDNTVLGAMIGASSLLFVNFVVVRLLFGHEKLDRLIEGDPDVLVEDGKILSDRLRSEVITLPELVSAAHKQGFAGLDEVERAVIEPGGTISFTRKKPDVATLQFREIAARLDEIGRTVSEIRAGGGPRQTA